jgi:hypothetical protein
MSKKILLVKSYVVVENKDDLFFVFDTEYLVTSDEDDFSLGIESKKYIFTFQDTSKIPIEKLKTLDTVGVVVNNKKDKQNIIEGKVLFY